MELRFSEKHEPLMVEIAKTKKQREKGLMYRTFLPKNTGMLFIYDYPTEVRFWMKNTRIPLDIIFIDPSGNIVKVVNDTVPFSLDIIESEQEIQYVLEVNAGFVNKLSPAIGRKLNGLPSVTKELAEC